MIKALKRLIMSHRQLKLFIFSYSLSRGLMRNLSKSKLMAFRQCEKRLWLEVHHPELRVDSAASQASFQVGYQVGDIARKLYDPDGKGVLVDFQTEGFKQAFEHTKQLLQTTQPIFEAGFSANGVLAFADVMIPDKQDEANTWHMIEVKSSTSIKDYHRDDVAVQAYVAKASGVSLKSVSVAYIDTNWVYPGQGKYKGLLVEENVTVEAFNRNEEVKTWVADAQQAVNEKSEPNISIGKHCSTPFDCSFYEYCARDEIKPEYPVNWLPRFSSAKKEELATQGIIDVREVPDELLNETQLRVKLHTLNNKIYFDLQSTKSSLEHLPFPAFFLDFETIQFAVPIWAGTRAYQQITFQFSLHTLLASGELQHSEFLDLSGNNPSEAFAKKLISVCGSNGAVFVYNAGFETARIREIAERYPELSEKLLAINHRVVDLLPIARQYYYNPSQQGSWSIKKVLPAVVPELSYTELEGVQDGGMAMSAFLEGIDARTTANRKAEIEQQLLAYCKLDTYAMVKLWQAFADRKDLNL